MNAKKKDAIPSASSRTNGADLKRGIVLGFVRWHF